MGILLFAAAVYVGIPVGKAYFRSLEYKDAIKQELRFRSTQPDSLIKRSLRLSADSLGLPKAAGELKITRKDGQITVEADYEEVISFFSRFHRVIRFQPRATATY
jgi:hypothetical protein